MKTNISVTLILTDPNYFKQISVGLKSSFFLKFLINVPRNKG